MKGLLQTIINILYRFPRSRLKDIKRKGGIINQYVIEKHRKAMVNTSVVIRVEPYPAVKSKLEICFLTGKKYWYQTVFCILSLSKVSRKHFSFIIYDDGTIDTDLADKIRKQVPCATIVFKSEIESRLNQYLPEDTYPFLRNKRFVYPHIKKLTDIYAGTSGWKLVLDSDMLFFNNPEIMINWLENPSQPFYILDSVNSYGYSKSLMNELSTRNLPDFINVGMVGLNNSLIDWDKLEYWAKTMESREGTSYYLEQALTAMIIGDGPAVIGPKTDYIVMPTKDQVINGEGVLHHYVDVSKEWYFKEAWKRFF